VDDSTSGNAEQALTPGEAAAMRRAQAPSHGCQLFRISLEKASGRIGRVRTPEAILRDSSTIAMVGASPDPARPSHGVMRYLIAQGYRVLPVHPTAGEVLGVPCARSLAELEEPIDLVDVFRREEAAPEHAREAVAAGAKAFWLQLRLRSPEARAICESAGLDYVEDECTAIVHRRL
jgi:predicted CoA-binding protein